MIINRLSKLILSLGQAILIFHYSFIDKIVFSSTHATYGEPENIPILETDRTLPTNCYGETKLSMEKMFKWTSKAHNLRCGVNYFPLTVSEHIELLKQTGFEHVHVFWCSYMQMGIYGIK